MSTRRRCMVYSSSSDDDDEQPPPQQPPQYHQLEHDDINDVVFEDAMIQQEDEEEEEEFEEADEEIEIPLENPIPSISAVTLNSTTTSTTAAAAVEILDDDFVDVADNLSPPSPPPPPPPVNLIGNTAFVASDCPVNDKLRRMGVCLRREWLSSCQLGLQNSVPGFGNFDIETKAKLCIGQFLLADMNFVGVGVLPENVCGLHPVDLAGPFVLQVDEVVNIGCPLKERYKNAAPGLKRCLKLSMTDGVQRVFGMEYRPIKSLAPLSPAGFKVVIRNVNVRRGLLMLVPEVLEVLGGSVEELEAARQRLVQEVNKPPRGKRTRNGTVPPLSSRATHAAWPQHGDTDHSVPNHVANPVPRNTTNSVVHGSSRLRETIQGAAADRETTDLPGMRGTNQQSISRESGRCSIRSGSDQYSINVEAALPPRSISTEAVQRPTIRETTDLPGMRGTNQQSISRESGRGSIRSGSDQYSINFEPAPPPRSSGTEAVQRPTIRESPSLSSVVEAHEVSREATDPPPRRESIVRNSFSTTVIEDEDVTADHVEHPFLLTGEKEFPFTYMASLLTKWETVKDVELSVQGKVKCFMTSVKRFQYRHQSTFELWGFIDDGSLMSEVFIHHNVVQSKVGYSPQEVTAALTSPDSDIVEAMKDTMKQFQIFLLSFEGTMVVEVNNTSSIPVVLEMTEGCLDFSPWQLLHRIKPPTSSPLHENDDSEIISLSP